MIVDIIVLVVLLISAGIAFLRGFIREVLTILGVVGGLVAAYFGGPVVSPVIREWFNMGNEGEGAEEASQKLFDLIPYDMAADALAYGSVFLIVVIVLSIASHFLSGWAKTIGLGAVDRTLGVIFGIARGVVILALFYMPFSIFFNKETRDNFFAESRTHFYIETTADWMLTMVPESVRDNLKGGKEDGEDMVKSARDKLQELDVLDNVKKEVERKMQNAGEQAPQPEDTEGYGDDQRDELNELFEENTNE